MISFVRSKARLTNKARDFAMMKIEAMRGNVEGSLQIIGPKPHRESELHPLDR
jgi:hypothetical protein